MGTPMHLVTLAQTYTDATGLALCTVSKRAAGQAHAITRLTKGKDITIGRAARIAKWFAFGPELQIGVDMATMVPEEMNIEFPGEAAVQGRSELYRDLVNYIDNQISIAVLGQTLTTQPGESGSYSLGQVQDIERAERGAFGSTSRAAPIPWGDIPARPFLGLSGSDRDELRSILIEFIEAGLR